MRNMSHKLFSINANARGAIEDYYRIADNVMRGAITLALSGMTGFEDCKYVDIYVLPFYATRIGGMPLAIGKTSHFIWADGRRAICRLAGVDMITLPSNEVVLGAVMLAAASFNLDSGTVAVETLTGFDDTGMITLSGSVTSLVANQGYASFAACTVGSTSTFAFTATPPLVIVWRSK